MTQLMKLSRTIVSGTRYRLSFLLKKLRARRQLRVLKIILVSNLRSVFEGNLSEPAASSLAVKNIRNHEIASNFLQYWKYKTGCQRTEWVGYDVFEKTVSRHGSVIVCSIHFGNYYIFPFEISKRGHDTVVVVGDQHKQMDLIQAIASGLNLPIRVITTDGYALLSLIRELKSGKVVYVLIDELGGAVNNEKLLQVPFLGHTLNFKKGVGALQYYSGLPVIPVIASIQGSNRSFIGVGEPMYPSDQPGERQETIDGTVRKLFSYFEPFIREEPAQWQKWIDLKRYEVVSSDRKSSECDIDVRKADLKISKDRVRILRDRKGYILIDMRQGRYFSIDRVGRYTVELMFRRNDFHAISGRLKRKFSLTDDVAEEYIRKIAAVRAL